MNETAETVYAKVDDEKFCKMTIFSMVKFQEAIKEAEKAHDKRKLLDFLDEYKISVEFGNFKFETEPNK
ncbi:MAG: hypothetical protein QXI91_00685 [Candidatus Bathyarchaeia archaeon]